ncbi:hypothetical protein BH11PLA2_BH11PLA2_51540 [soil metagenome]
MKFYTKCLVATAMIALMVVPALAGYTVVAGKIKSLDAENKTFILTDLAEKDHTFKIGDALVVNRAGKEGKSDLKTGDTINLCYDKGTLSWTAHYILVQEGNDTKSTLMRGSVKGYDESKKELTITSDAKEDTTYPSGKTMVRVNMEGVNIDTVKIGDHALFLLDVIDGKTTLRSVMIDRAK